VGSVSPSPDGIGGAASLAASGRAATSDLGLMVRAELLGVCLLACCCWCLLVLATSCLHQPPPAPAPPYHLHRCCRDVPPLLGRSPWPPSAPQPTLRRLCPCWSGSARVRAAGVVTWCPAWP
jgi:hypothetical protein